jgi:triphosphoribosyl-dephospho-CoA synthase
MDHALFLASARALEPCFAACAREGMEATETGPTELLERLRVVGRAGEVAMFRATGGINTHKGAIFCLGLLCAAAGYLLQEPPSTAPLGDRSCLFVARICEGLVSRELQDLGPGAPRTAGERLYRERGIRGARGQAEDGYPILRLTLLPLLRDARSRGLDRFRSACLDGLLQAMVELEDSCLLVRGGPAGLAFACERARDVLRHGGTSTPRGMRALESLDQRMSQEGLSPGGCADMLAAALFLVEVERASAQVLRRIA